MTLIVGLLTFLLFLNCLLLILLVLIQLPKKEAGAGAAFGGGATDALFGAGSGNALTKITKYAATIFFVLVLVLSTLQSRRAANTKDEIAEELKATQTTPVVPPNQPTSMLTAPLPEPKAPAQPAPETVPAVPE